MFFSKSSLDQSRVPKFKVTGVQKETQALTNAVLAASDGTTVWTALASLCMSGAEPVELVAKEVGTTSTEPI